MRTRVPCVGAVVRNDAGRLLVIRRARPPGQGRWSLPGGRVEPGESDASALGREVREETGLLITAGALVGTVERDGPGGVVYEIKDYDCTVAGGVVAAGDDAAEVRWVTCAELLALPTTGGLLDALRSWGVMPG